MKMNIQSESFNPAEAREGFSRNLKEIVKAKSQISFNPAEAREGFSRE